jgi:maltooligosyltrehalose trehalohydrolase
MRPGARKNLGGSFTFSVWAPFAQKVLLVPEKKNVMRAAVDLEAGSSGQIPGIMMERKNGYWHKEVEGIQEGYLYSFLLDDIKKRPDPASCFQPYGVHGPSQVIDHSSHKWNDRHFRGIDKSNMIIYELHTGTFTPEGDFRSAAARLDDLRHTGINTLELMPVAQFAGERNWGYDGVYPYAVQDSYGGPEGLRLLVEECHIRDIAVILDVVYNHLGPEGNYLSDFGPYFTDRYRSFWGKAINFDQAYSDQVRSFFIQNALDWYENYHIDGLRLDAVHGIFDMSATHFLKELRDRIDIYLDSKKAETGSKVRPFYLIAESDLNDSRLIRPSGEGGYGLDAQWSDDFHHAIHAFLTGENSGYYMDFGELSQLEKAYREAFVYTGQFSAYRKKSHGSHTGGVPGSSFVVFCQNHDQVGNRPGSNRLVLLLDHEKMKIAAAYYILSPYIPLIFMGEEYGEDHPFHFFISFPDKDLVQSITKGRKEEYSSFDLGSGDLPEPDKVRAFMDSKIQWEKRKSGKNRLLLDYYRKLILMRKTSRPLSGTESRSMYTNIDQDKKILTVKRQSRDESVIIIFNFSDIKTEGISLSHHADSGHHNWDKILYSAETEWGGPGGEIGDMPALQEVFAMERCSAAVFASPRKEQS